MVWLPTPPSGSQARTGAARISSRRPFTRSGRYSYVTHGSIIAHTRSRVGGDEDPSYRRSRRAADRRAQAEWLCQPGRGDLRLPQTEAAVVGGTARYRTRRPAASRRPATIPGTAGSGTRPAQGHCLAPVRPASRVAVGRGGRQAVDRAAMSSRGRPAVRSARPRRRRVPEGGSGLGPAPPRLSQRDVPGRVPEGGQPAPGREGPGGGVSSRMAAWPRRRPRGGTPAGRRHRRAARGGASGVFTPRRAA
jgi:hypothetical protein